MPRQGGKDRVTILPNSLIKPLRVQLATAKQLHEQAWPTGTGLSTCPMLWNGNIRTPTKSGFGSTFSLLRNDPRPAR